MGWWTKFWKNRIADQAVNGASNKVGEKVLEWVCWWIFTILLGSLAYVKDWYRFLFVINYELTTWVFMAIFAGLWLSTWLWCRWKHQSKSTTQTECKPSSLVDVTPDKPRMDGVEAAVAHIELHLEWMLTLLENNQQNPAPNQRACLFVVDGEVIRPVTEYIGFDCGDRPPSELNCAVGVCGMAIRFKRMTFDNWKEIKGKRNTWLMKDFGFTQQQVDQIPGCRVAWLARPIFTEDFVATGTNTSNKTPSFIIFIDSAAVEFFAPKPTAQTKLKERNKDKWISIASNQILKSSHPHHSELVQFSKGKTAYAEESAN